MNSFELVANIGSMRVMVAGDVGLEAVKSPMVLNAAAVANYIGSECKELLGHWTMGNLIKIREMLKAYMTSTFKDYTITSIQVTWENGQDRLSIG